MKAGHIFTIEPMINEGKWQDDTWPDNWTSVTVDGKRYWIVSLLQCLLSFFQKRTKEREEKRKSKRKGKKQEIFCF